MLSVQCVHRDTVHVYGYSVYTSRHNTVHSSTTHTVGVHLYCVATSTLIPHTSYLMSLYLSTLLLYGPSVLLTYVYVLGIAVLSVCTTVLCFPDTLHHPDNFCYVDRYVTPKHIVPE